MTLYSTILVICIAIILIIAIVFFIASKKEQEQKETNLDEEAMLDRVTEKTNSIISRAIERANEMLVSAELKGIQTVAKRKLEVEEYEHLYEKDLENLLGTTLGEFVTATEKMLTSYRHYLTSIEEKIVATTRIEEERLKSHFSELNEATQNSFTQYLKTAETVFQTRITQDLEKMEARLELYEQQKQNVIDEQIVFLVQETTKRVLGKTLSLKDHADLVYKALNEAKNTGLIEGETNDLLPKEEKKPEIQNI